MLQKQSFRGTGPPSTSMPPDSHQHTFQLEAPPLTHNAHETVRQSTSLFHKALALCMRHVDFQSSSASLVPVEWIQPSENL